jgi:radical SAM protein with 4Fe4S-binding SPASM domain
MTASQPRTGLDDGRDQAAESHDSGRALPAEHDDLAECEVAIENIGWTLGNECPYRCTHCYSMSARRKGMDLDRRMVDRIVAQLRRLGVKTVNLGGNEPLFTNGANPRATLLPYIIESLVDAGIHVGLTTSGISLVHLERDHNRAFRLLNDVDISFDSPDPEEHNRNRGAALYSMAVRSLEICRAYGIDRTVIMCAMSWNFTARHIGQLLELACKYDAHVRINPLKPVERQHMLTLPSPRQFYQGFSLLLAGCSQVDLGEPLLAAACSHPGCGCPCGRKSFRIHSITPDCRVPVSPCVYMHEYKVGDLLTMDILDIVYSPAFRAFRRRNGNPGVIRGCAGCRYLTTCRGGCAARSYLHHLHEVGERSLYQKDPYCLAEAERGMADGFPVFPQHPSLPQDKVLVHKDYLCTWIGKPLS